VPFVCFVVKMGHYQRSDVLLPAPNRRKQMGDILVPLSLVR